MESVDLEKKIEDVIDLKFKQMLLKIDAVEKPSGAKTNRLIVKYPKTCAILGVLPSNQVIMVKQYRYAFGENLVQLPGGKVDPGETPLESAFREFREETGFSAGDLVELLSYYPTASYSSEITYIYFAKDIKQEEILPQNDEILKVELIPLNEIYDKLKNNEINDPKVLLGLFIAQKMGLLT